MDCEAGANILGAGAYSGANILGQGWGWGLGSIVGRGPWGLGLIDWHSRQIVHWGLKGLT